MRRSFNSWLVHGGAPKKTIQDLMGHTSDKMTGLYTFSGTAEKRSAMAVL